MWVCETLFISTFTISCLRINEASLLDHDYDSSEVQFFVMLSLFSCCTASTSMSVEEIYSTMSDQVKAKSGQVKSVQVRVRKSHLRSDQVRSIHIMLGQVKCRTILVQDRSNQVKIWSGMVRSGQDQVSLDQVR